MTLLRNRPNQAPAILEGLRFEGAELELGSSGESIPVGKNTSTYKQLLALKKAVCREGIFRYDDMYAFAERYLRQYPSLSEVVRKRFPWVFIDEMQDTSAMQCRLLALVFGDGSVVQRMGDINQAIFNIDDDGAEESDFPREGFLVLSTSKRFGVRIAELSSRVTAVQEQDIIGDEREQTHPPTVFLFDEMTIGRVLPSFGDYVLGIYPDGLSTRWPVKAVGYRKSPSEEPNVDRIPYSIRDYWESFEPAATTKATRSETFLGCVREVRNELRHTGQWAPAYDRLVSGVVDFLNREGFETTDEHRFTRSRLIEALKTCGDSEFLAFQQALLDFGSTRDLTLESWQLLVQKLCWVLVPLVGDVISEEGLSYLAWVHVPAEEPRNQVLAVGLDRVNTYLHTNGSRDLEIDVTTIHSVKGETHLATLILETYWYGHDLSELASIMAGRRDRRGFRGKRRRERAKRVFVGMTRPRDILCLAIHKQHIEDDTLEAMQQDGWDIRDLTIGS